MKLGEMESKIVEWATDITMPEIDNDDLVRLVNLMHNR